MSWGTTQAKFTPEVDELIRAYYARPVRGRQKELAAKIGVCPNAIYFRAKDIGIETPPRTRKWTEKEDMFLEKHAHLLDADISKLMEKKLRIWRTPRAVNSRRYELGLHHLDPAATGHFSCVQVAEILGLNPTVIRRWCKWGHLPSKKMDINAHAPSCDYSYRIKQSDLRQFLFDYPTEWKIEKVSNQLLLLDILKGK